jgi:hypothetical protein
MLGLGIDEIKMEQSRVVSLILRKVEWGDVKQAAVKNEYIGWECKECESVFYKQAEWWLKNVEDFGLV